MSSEFLSDKSFADRIAEENPTLGRAILDSIRNVLNKIRTMLSIGTKDNTFTNMLLSELDIFKEAEQLWLNALHTAAKNSADGFIMENNGEIKYQIYDLDVSQSDIDSFVDNALDNIGENKDYRKYANVSSKLAKDVITEIPDIKEYSHAIRDNDVRHINNSHGEGNLYEKYPVTRTDIKLIPYIVKNYDKVFVSNYKNGKSIYYVKAFDNGIVYYLEQATDKYGNEKLLINKQMIKTGINTIPDYKPLRNAINKKQTDDEFLNDMNNVPQEYAQSVYQHLSVDNNLPQQEDSVKNNARWTTDRIDYLIDDYGATDPNYSKAYAAFINPADFLKLTVRDEVLDKWNDKASTNPDEVGTPEGLYPLDEKELVKSLRVTPQLILKSGSQGNQVYSHEGRHRMRALMEKGINEVPVVIEDTDTKTSKKPMGEMVLSSQDYGDGAINNGAEITIRDLVPINNANRDTLIEKFGGDAQVRFSISEQQDTDYLQAVESGDMEKAYTIC